MKNSKDSQPNSAARLVTSYYLRHALNYPRWLAGLGISVPVTVLVNNYLPALIAADVLSKLSQHRYISGQIWQSFGTELMLYVGLLLVGIAFWRLVDFFMWRLEMSIQQDIAEEVFDHMLSRSADFHANNFSGSLVSQTNKLLGSYVRVADTTIFQSFPMVVGLVLTVIILTPRAPLFVLGLVTFTFLYISTAFIITKPVQQKSARFAAAETKQTGFLADAITNAMAISGYARGDYEKRRFHKTTTFTRSKLADFARLHQRQMNTLGSLNRMISGSALVLAVVVVMRFGADIGTVFLILSYTATTVDQLFRFSNDSLRSYNRAIGDARDMAHTLSQAPEIQDPVNPEPVAIKDGAISFDGVTFTHNGANDAIFDALTLHIKSGEKVGLVGHSGSGKTTFTRLLMRFSDVESGKVQIDGQDISHITQDDLHRNIAYVPQEPLLFHRTLAENIAYGAADASQQDIERAADMAHAAGFIAALPDGYDTLVGERGVKLSGGQRQRVAIARAMLKNAPILVLDEATSALDSESEHLIQDALWRLMDDKTAIVIAHRLSTIQKMDRIIVLDDGKIVEEGSHKQLIARKGTYAKLWARQSGGFIED